MQRSLKDIASQEDVFCVVSAQLARIRAGVSAGCWPDISSETSLTADLGLDSISLIEAFVVIEKDLNIVGIQMADWNDREATHTDGARFTVGSLVQYCLQQPLA